MPRGPGSPHIYVHIVQEMEALAKVMTLGLALLKVKPPNSLAEWIQAMSEMTTAVHKAPGIPSAKCYRYKWVVRGFWDFARKQAGAAPGITWQGHHTVLRGNPRRRSSASKVLIDRIPDHRS